MKLEGLYEGFKAGLSIRGFFAWIRINPKIRKINKKI